MAGPHVANHDAMLKFASETESPLAWNAWQQKANAVQQEEFSDHKDLCVTTGMVWDQYLTAMCKEMMEELHGPEWRKGLRLQPTRVAGDATSAGDAVGALPATGTLL